MSRWPNPENELRIRLRENRIIEMTGWRCSAPSKSDVRSSLVSVVSARVPEWYPTLILTMSFIRLPSPAPQDYSLRSIFYLSENLLRRSSTHDLRRSCALLSKDSQGGFFFIHIYYILSEGFGGVCSGSLISWRSSTTWRTKGGNREKLGTDPRHLLYVYKSSVYI